MGYLLLALSLLTGAAKGYCGKRTSGYINEYKDAMIANFFRMLFCVIIGFVLIIFQSGALALKINSLILVISVLSGIASSVFVVTWLVSVKTGAYVMMDVFLMLGMTVPLLGSFICFNEDISPIRILGVFLLIVAALVMCSYNNSIKGKMSAKNILLLVACGVSSGLADFSQKLFVEFSDNVLTSTFTFYTYVFSAIVLGLCYICVKNGDAQKYKKLDIKKVMGYLIVMSVCLFANSYFQTQAAMYLPSAQLYPLSKGCALILSLIMSAVFFKERISIKCIAGMVLAFFALLLINFFK